jgi:hypothetical protein
MLIREILAAWGCGMIIRSKYTAAIALTLAVAAMTAPSFAETSKLRMSAARAPAIHECNVRAQKFPTLPSWGNVGICIYRACMAEHHQME